MVVFLTVGGAYYKLFDWYVGDVAQYRCFLQHSNEPQRYWITPCSISKPSFMVSPAAITWPYGYAFATVVLLLN